MSFMDKLKFWKSSEPDFGDLETDIENKDIGRDNEFGSHDNLGLDTPDKNLAMGRMEEDEDDHYNQNYNNPDQRMGNLGQTQTIRGPNIGREIQPQMQQQNLNQMNMGSQQPTDHIEKDLEIISTKLELIKVTIESLNQRLMSIERKLDNNEKRW